MNPWIIIAMFIVGWISSALWGSHREIKLVDVLHKSVQDQMDNMLKLSEQRKLLHEIRDYLRYRYGVAECCCDSEYPIGDCEPCSSEGLIKKIEEALAPGKQGY